MRSLAIVLNERSRRNRDDPYFFHTAHRRYGGRIGYEIPAHRDIIRDRHREIVIQKSAQTGLTDLMISKLMHAADTGVAGRGAAVLVMPTQRMAEEFVGTRVDPAIDQSSYLRSRIEPDKPARRGADSRRLKQLGQGTLITRGADVAQMQGFPADVLCLDEYDLMDQQIRSLARNRLASSQAGQMIIASTPRLPEAGINQAFLESDRRYFFISCPRCGLKQTLDFEHNVDHEAMRIVCRSCNDPMNTLADGEWVPEVTDGSPVHGYFLNRLYLPWVDIPALVERSLSPSTFEQQEFYNSDLGVPFSPAGEGFNLALLDSARRDYRLSDYAGETCVMGVDVGYPAIHVVIREDADHGNSSGGDQREHRLWFCGVVNSFEDLDHLYRKFNIACSVIDAQPNTLGANEFARSHFRGYIAYFTVREGEHVFQNSANGRAAQVSMNRSLAFQQVADRFRDGRFTLPADSRSIGGEGRDGIGNYYRQIINMTRALVRDQHENLRQQWTANGRDDHFAAAETYVLAAVLAGSRHRLGLHF